MKRVKSACLYQTLVFILDPKVSKEEALSKVQTEVEVYKKKANSDIQILNETINEDGSVEIQIRKKVSEYSVGNYFDKQEKVMETIKSYSSIDEIKEKIKSYYLNKKEILFSQHGGKLIKLILQPAFITNVYDNFFNVETMINDYNEIFSICYRDIYIGLIKIEEVN